jgi:putative peptide zinc metalloprotease protein
LLVREGELNTARTSQRGLQSQKLDYQPVAPMDGRFRLADPDLKPGTWLARNEQVGILVSERGWHVECYVSEEVVHRIAIGDKAHFYPEARPGSALGLVVSGIDRDATHILDAPVLAVPFGGSVDVREVDGKLVPEKAAYRVTLDVRGSEPALADHSWRGAVVINAAPESLAARWGRVALALLWREAGL